MHPVYKYEYICIFDNRDEISLAIFDKVKIVIKLFTKGVIVRVEIHLFSIYEMKMRPDFNLWL